MSTAAGLRPDGSFGETAISFDPQVHGESSYDRVTTALMAVVIGSLLVFVWELVILATTKGYDKRVSQRVTVIEVAGGGGGDPNGVPGESEAVEVPGAEAAENASNNETDADSFEDPQVMDTPAIPMDAIEDSALDTAAMDLAEPMSGNSVVASGRRASKLPKGGGHKGFGPGGSGNGGYSREERWKIIYPPGQTLEEYARQLDFFKVELGAIVNGSMQVASNFSGTPSRRTINHTTDKRLYFTWQGAGRKANDVALLRKAGINPGGGAIFQFYPPDVEDDLSQMEVKFKGKQPAYIRRTVFQVVPEGGGFTFKVVRQDPLM